MNLNDLLDRLIQLEIRLQKIEGHLDLTDEQEASSDDIDAGATTTTDLMNQIKADDLASGSDRILSISAGRIRVPSLGILAVGGEQSQNDQITGLMDALHWHRWANLRNSKLSYVLGHSDRLLAVSQAIALLLDTVNKQFEFSFQVDFNPFELQLPDLNGGSEVRCTQLQARDEADLPALARAVNEQVRDCCFRWNRTLTGNEWSGRVDGLEVCRLDQNGKGILRLGELGRTGKESMARERFRGLVGRDEFHFDESNLQAAVAVIANLAADRRRAGLSKVQLEHMLESRILRKAVALEVNGQQLEPVESQFPAIWSEGGETKYIDVIAKQGDIPWVVELKVHQGGGQGQYYRNSVGQAVLYREFIRRATGLHRWFEERGLDANKCRAAVAFPTKGTPRQRETALEHVGYLASLFDVEVIVLPDDWNAPEL